MPVPQVDGEESTPALDEIRTADTSSGPSPTPIDLPSDKPLEPPGRPAASRKRKRAQPSAPPQSATPPAPGESSQQNVDLLSGRQDLFSRPIITISRAPVFIPLTVDESSSFHTTELLPNNRIGFFYTPAGIKPDASARIVPCRTIESTPTSYRVSWEDRSPFIKVSRDGLSLLGDRGYRSSRCNAPVREGKWYIEIKVTRGGGDSAQSQEMPTKRGEDSYVRLGWARREASLNGPVGVDAYSYGFRDKTGEKVTISRPTSYGKSYGTGDVIGMYISLPPKREADPKDASDPARLHRQRIAIEFKGQEYFESLEYPVVKEMSKLLNYAPPSANATPLPSSTTKKSATVKNVPERPRAKPAPEEKTPETRALPTLPGSRIAFFVNGECQGPAYQDIYDYLQLRKEPIQKAKEKKKRDGAREHRENPFDDGYLGYYPFISLFNHASVRINPGPDFEFAPPPDIDAVLDGTAASGDNAKTWRPICERYPEFMEEQWALDALEEEEAKVEADKRAKEQQKSAPKKAAKPRRKPVAQEVKKRPNKKATVAGAGAISARQSFVEDQRFAVPNSVQPSPLRVVYTAESEGENLAQTAASSPAPAEWSMTVDSVDAPLAPHPHDIPQMDAALLGL